jgi:hypothetical protein
MPRHAPPVTFQIAIRLIFCGVLIFSLNAAVKAQEKSPERGFRPAGSYALSDMETISTTSGNMMVRVPLSGLPPGRGGLAAALSLIYNSKLYDAFPSRY